MQLEVAIGAFRRHAGSRRAADFEHSQAVGFGGLWHRHGRGSAESEDRLGQLGRAADWRTRDQQRGRTLVSDAEIIQFFDRRDIRAADDHPERPAAAQSPQPPAPRPGYASPALVLLATVCILGGYTLLNVIPTSGWRPSTIAFVALSVPLALALGRPRRTELRTTAQRVMVVTSVVLAAVSILALAADRSSTARLLGVYALVFALIVLGVVTANERGVHHRR